MPSSIEDILAREGPCLSSRIAEILVNGGLSADAARQRLSRVREPVARLRGINFPNREKFMFLRNDFGKPEFLESLEAELIKARTAAGCALLGLEARGGTIRSEWFSIASGLPVHKTKGRLLHSTVEQQLLQVKLITSSNYPDGTVISRGDGAYSNRGNAVATVEDIVLSSIRLWLIKVGWSSLRTLKIRRPLYAPEFGQFSWDIVGPCYLFSIRRGVDKDVEPGFLVGDITLDRTLSLDDLIPFFNKWDCLVAQRRKQRFQPLIIADSFKDDALDKLRKRGALICMPRVFLGEEIAKDLRSLVVTLTNAAAAVIERPDSVFELINRLSKLEGASLNLKGVTFEMMLGRIYALQGYNFDVREQIQDSQGNRAEIDVKARNNIEVVCCECKAKNAGNLVDCKEIEDWMQRVVPRIKDWLKNFRTPQVRRFEFYTSSDYTEPAQELIRQIEHSHKKIPIRFFNGRDFIQKLRDLGESALITIFNEQFR
jgi:hypothetical protein